MNMRSYIIAASVLLAAASPALGDVLSLTRGEVLNGMLLDLSDGVVVFDTRLAGQVVVPVSQVRSITTNQPFVVQLNDGKRIEGRLAGSGGETRIVPSSGGEGEVVQWATVESITPVRASLRQDTDLPDAGPSSLDISWEGGYFYRWGHREYDAAFTRLTLRNRAEAFDFRSDSFLEISSEDAFPRLFRSASEWRFPSTRALQPELGFEIERDLDEALKFRGGLHVGLTRVFMDEPDRLFEATGGLNIEFEHYDAELFWRETGSGLRNRFAELYYGGDRRHIENQDINMRLRMRLRRAFDRAVLTQAISLYPSLTEFGELRGRSESAFQMPLSSQLHFRLHLLVDYENEPEFKRMDNWRTSIGAGFEWDF